jgi:hypothetical protein
MYLHFVINNCTHKLNNVTLTVKCRSPKRKKSSVRSYRVFEEISFTTERLNALDRAKNSIRLECFFITHVFIAFAALVQ